MDFNLNDSQLISIVRADIDESESYFDSEIRPKIEENYKKYKADEDYYKEKMGELSKKSKFLSSDIGDTIEGTLPSMMKIFHGTDDVISISGKSAEDNKKAENMQNLCNFQLTNQNEGFMLSYRWIKDALITALGVVKGHWKREYEEIDHRETVGLEQLQLLNAAEEITIVEVEEAIGGFNEIGEAVAIYHVTYKQERLKENKPVFENMDGAGLLYDPECTSVNDAQYMIHRKYTTVDDLRRKEKDGIYSDVEKAIEQAESGETMDTMKDILDDNMGDPNANDNVNKARDRVVLYEYYGKIDVNQDGLLEDVIITMVGDTIISKQENIYGMFPFFVLSPILEPFTLHGKSFGDLIGQLQDLKTALIKEIMVNIAQSNDGREYIDPTAVDISDLVNNKKYIRVNAQGGSIAAHVQPKSFTQMHPMTMNVLEYIDGVKENRTGITRYNQGLDASSLNHTATGIQTIMNAANQKLELIARVMAETGYKSLFKFLVTANNKFIDQNTVVRLNNEYLDIAPDDLTGEFDLTVSAGTGISDTQVQNTQLNEVMQIQGAILKPEVMQSPNYKYIYYTAKKKLETMGYKNVNDFIPSPEQLQEQMAMQQQQQMMQGGMNGAMAGQPQPANAGNEFSGGSGASQAVPNGAGGQMPAELIQAMAMQGQ